MLKRIFNFLSLTKAKNFIEPYGAYKGDGTHGTLKIAEDAIFKTISVNNSHAIRFKTDDGKVHVFLTETPIEKIQAGKSINITGPHWAILPTLGSNPNTAGFIKDDIFETHLSPVPN